MTTADIWNPGQQNVLVPVVSTGGVVHRKTFIATEGQKTFSWTGVEYQTGSNAISVFVNGSYVFPTYVQEASSTSITLLDSEGCLEGDEVLVVISPASVSPVIQVFGCPKICIKDFDGSLGNNTSMSAALAAAYAKAVSVGGDVYIPAGRYRITTPFVADYTGNGAFGIKRPSIVGEGANVVEIISDISGATPAMTFRGEAWTTGSYMSNVISGFTLRGVGFQWGQVGLFINRAIDVDLQNLVIMEFDKAIDLTDVVHLSLDKCSVIFNNRAITANRTPIYGISNNGSPVNIVTLKACAITNNRTYGMDLWDSSNITILGGSFEGNGLAAVGWTQAAERYSIRIRNAGYNGAAGLTMVGTHFESNSGNADIWIDHGAFEASYDFIGCDFVRNGFDLGFGLEIVTNNILFTSPGTTKASLNVRSGFRHVNGYVPSAARRYVGFIATGFLHNFNDVGSVYASNTEYPVFQGISHRQENHIFAFALFSGAGTVFAQSNVASVTKTGTGAYNITFSKASATNLYMAFQLAGTERLQMRVVGRTTSVLSILFENSAGTATDPGFEAGVAVINSLA